MKIELKDRDGNEIVHEFPPVGEGQDVLFPFLFEARSGGRNVPLSHLKDDALIQEMFSKTVDLDPDFRAIYFAEIFVQLMSFKAFSKFFQNHFIVNHVVEPEGRYFKIVVEYCPDGVTNLDEDERDLIYDEAFKQNVK